MTTDQAELALAEKQVMDELRQREKLTNEEFKIWKKTVPLLYDTVQTQALDVPSLALQWLPQYELDDSKRSMLVRLLIGTAPGKAPASLGEPVPPAKGQLKLVQFSLPSTMAPDFASAVPGALGVPVPQHDSDGSSFRVLRTWRHNGEVNAIKLSPNGEHALTFDGDGVVHLYAVGGAAASDEASQDPVSSFKYHKQEGFALEWLDNDHFLSGANDSQIAYWETGKPLTPIQVLKTHAGAINALSAAKSARIFASVSDDSTVQIHDLQITATPVIKFETTRIQHAVAFHPEVTTLFLTAGRDNVISLYDLRNPTKPIRKFFGHEGDVLGVMWDVCDDPAVFVSWGVDKRVMKWDISSIDEEFVYPTVADSPTSSGSAPSAATAQSPPAPNGIVGKRKPTRAIDPCLKFIHGGHADRVNAVDLHPKISGLVACCGSDTLLQVWRAKTIFEEADEEEEGEEEEEEAAETAEGTDKMEE